MKSFFIILYSLCLSAYLYAQPTISSFSPASGPTGTSVVINGTNFSPVAANNTVYFGAVKAIVTSATSNALSVVVPYGATYEPITVNTSGLTAYSANPFIVTFPDGGAITSNSFADKIDLPAGESPYDIASGDLDGDGKPDMVVVNGGYPYSISIYKNTSTSGVISFATKTDIPTGIAPFSVAISDIDGDGKPDIVITNGSSFSISVFRNNGTTGNISFDARVDFSALNPALVVVGDLNKDGKPDLIVTNYVAHSISIYKNTSSPGTVSFAAKTDYPTGQYPADISIGDIDGDSWKDVVVANDESNYISIFKNDAAPGLSFTINNSLITGVDADNIILADFDGDNKPDLGVNKGLSFVSIYRNISSAGNMAFSSGLDFKTAENPTAFAIADLDGDGKPDLAYSCGSDSISVLKNTSSSGSISFQDNISFLTAKGPYDLSIADFDGDGKPDLATANQEGNTVSLLRNTVDGPDVISFSPTQATAGGTVTITGTRFTGITEVRFGGVPAQSFTVVSPSTIQAVVGTGASGEVRVTGSKGTGRAQGFTFLVPTGPLPPVITSFTPATGPVGTTVTITGQNFDSSPLKNIVYFGATRATVLSASATGLTVQVPGGATYQPITVTANRLTGSSAIPFVVTFEEGPAFTANSFDLPKMVDPNPDYQNLAYQIADADIDGDGKIDIVYGRYPFRAARNTSTANSISFATPQNIMQDRGGTLIDFGDIDGDGKPDLVSVANTGSGNGTFNVLKNLSSVGSISFVDVVSYPVPNAVFSFSIKDVDLDGKPDLIIPVSEGDYMSIYRNMSYNGAIQFATKADVTTGDAPVHVSSGDLDGDGKPEVVIVNNAENSISIFPNNSSPGAINFGSKVTYKTTIGPVATTLSDFDGDGKLDIAVLINGGQIQIFKNTSTIGSISFSLVTSFSTYSFPSQMRSADLNGDGKPDLAVNNDGFETITVYKNVSNTTAISFSQQVWYDADHIYGGLEIADFNGDGKNDMVSGAASINIGILKNKVGTARIIPAGSNPVKGEINNRMTFDQTVKTYNGNPYVQRHYDVEPADNPATSTATVTLYFTQQDFDNFNAFPGHGPDLPKNPGDASGVANLRVYQFHGFSTTSLPGSYNGVGTEINPDDANIIWNVKAGCWEVTFSVTGFSGFFVSNGNFNSTPPPVISASGTTTFCPGGNVILTSSITTGNQWYKDGIIITGANLSTYQATTSGIYTASATVNGYASLASNGIVVWAGPVAQPVISSDGTNLTSSVATGYQWYRDGVAIAGAVNQTYKPVDAANYTVMVISNGCPSPVSAAFYFVPPPTVTIEPGTIICTGQFAVLTSSAPNNQWYRDGVKLEGETGKTYQTTQTNQSAFYSAKAVSNNVVSATSNIIALYLTSPPPKPVITVEDGYLVSSIFGNNQWYENGVKIPGATATKYKPLRNGNYSVVHTAPGTACSSESNQFYFAVTGIINIDNTHFIKLSPNPVRNEVLLNYDLAGINRVNLQILNLHGQISGNYTGLSNGSKLNLSGFANGVYLVKIIDPISKKNYIIKLMKL